MSGTIVCGVSDSEAAATAIGVAAELSRRLGLRLVLVNVADTISDPLGEALESVSGRNARLAARKLLQRLIEEHRLDGVVARDEAGDPALRLAHVAAEERAQLIVIGSRRVGLLRKRLRAGLAAALSEASPCPVVVAPPQRVPAAGVAAAAR